MQKWSVAKVRYPTLFAAALAMLGACGDDNGGRLPDGGPAASARIRFVNASPDAPAFDVFVKGETNPIAQDIAYGEASQYVNLQPDTYAFELRNAGTSDQPFFTSAAVDLARGERVTAIAAGFVGGTGNQAFRIAAFTENFERAPAGQTVVRMVNVSPDAPTLAIDINNDGQAEVESVTRFEATPAPGINVVANKSIQIGVADSQNAQAITSFTTPALPENDQIFLIVTGRLTDRLPRQADSFSILAVGKSGVITIIRQNPTAFLLQGSPDAPAAMDVFIGNTPVVSGLEFGQLSGPIQLAPGRYDLAFFPAGQGPNGTPVATATTANFEAGERYLEIDTGFVAPSADQPGFGLINAMENFPLTMRDKAGFEFIHASPNAPAVDISTVGSNGQLQTPLLVRNLGFSNVSDPVLVPPANIVAGIAPSDSRTPVAAVPVTTVAGQRTFAVILGLVNAQPSLRVVAIETTTFPWVSATLSQ